MSNSQKMAVELLKELGKKWLKYKRGFFVTREFFATAWKLEEKINK